MNNNQILESRIRFYQLVDHLYRTSGSDHNKSEWVQQNTSLSLAALSKIKNGTQAVRDQNIVEILNINPNINVGWIFDGQGKMITSSSGKVYISGQVSPMSEITKNQKMIIEVLRKVSEKL